MDTATGGWCSVTPVTSLVERWERGEPSVNHARARATVYRALGIPRWADGIDLRATDRWFDGDTFLEREHGRLDRAIPRLLDGIRNGALVRFQAPTSSAGGNGQDGDAEDIESENPIQEWWKDLTVTKLVLDGFTDLGLSVLQTGVDAGGKWLVGNLLDAWGLKSIKDFLLPPSDTQVIIRSCKRSTRA